MAGEGGEAEVSAREALRSLVGAARAWLELHRDAGTYGLPSAFESPGHDEAGGVPHLASVVALAPPFAPDAPSAAAFAPDAPSSGTFAADAADVGAFEAERAPAPAVEANVGARAAALPVERAAPQGGLFSLGVDGGPIRPGLPLGVEVPDGVEARLTRLQVLAGEAAGCTRCRLHAGRTKSVFSRGNPRARIMFVGEGPGADEDAQGQPFVGKSGQLLDRMVAAMGLQQDEIYIANVVKCRPPQNRKPEPDEMSTCVPYLAEQIALIEPEVLIALGGTAVEGLLGGRVAITRARGQWRLYRATIPVMPTYHPAYLLRNPPAKREVWGDLRSVLQRLGRTVPGKGA